MSKHDELDTLLSELIDGELTPDQRARLAELVEAVPEARARYLAHCQLHAEIAWAQGKLGFEHCDFVDKTADNPTSPSKKARPLAVALLIGGFLAVLVTFAMPQLRAWQWSRGPEIGRVTSLSGTPLRIEGSSVELTDGEVLRPGDYLLETGVVGLRTKLGVELLIEAPAAFLIQAESPVELAYGRLIANVPEQGVGFTVLTATAEIVDLGTRFGVDVSATGGASEIHVFEGQVEVKGRHSGAMPVRLHSNDATQVLTIGNDPAAIPLARDRFVALNKAEYLDLVRDFGAIAHYRMAPADDENALIDSIGDHHGAVVEHENSSEVFAAGKNGASLSIGGNGGANAVVEGLFTGLPENFTFSGFVRADSSGGTIVALGNGIFLDHYQDGRLSLGVRHGESKRIRLMDETIFPLEEWQHVAFTLTGDQATLYRNGEPVATGQINGGADSPIILTPDVQLFLGARRSSDKLSPIHRWHGRMDDVAIFPSALSAEQISLLYQSAQ